MNFKVQLQNYWILESLFMIMEVNMRKILMTLKDIDMVYLNWRTVMWIKKNRKMETQLSWY